MSKTSTNKYSTTAKTAKNTSNYSGSAGSGGQANKIFAKSKDGSDIATMTEIQAVVLGLNPDLSEKIEIIDGKTSLVLSDPYSVPTIGTPTINPIPGSNYILETGQTWIATVTISSTISNDANFLFPTAILKENNIDTGETPSGTSSPVSFTKSVNWIGYSHNVNTNYKITGNHVQAGLLTSGTRYVRWYDKILWGQLPNPAQTTFANADFANLVNGGTSIQANKVVNGATISGAGYKWLCIPTSMGALSTWKDPNNGNIDVDYILHGTVSRLDNGYGLVKDYYVYRSKNSLGASLTFNIT